MPRVEIPVGKGWLSGHLVLPPHGSSGRRPGALFVHGWGGSQRAQLVQARRLAGAGVLCLTMNLRGHAETRHQRERVSPFENLEDVLAAFDLLRRQPGVDPRCLGAVGSSYGGFLVVLLTRVRKVRWLALQAPALYQDHHLGRPKAESRRDPQLAVYRRLHLPPEKNLVLATAARFRGDVLLVESEHDDVIPRRVLANYARAFGRVRSLERCVLAASHGLDATDERRAFGVLLAGWVSRGPATGMVLGHAGGVQGGEHLRGARSSA
jgi:dienelactone hydrolase